MPPTLLQSIGASRFLIQSTLQDEVLAHNGGRLEVMDGRRVSGLVWSDDRGTVLGGWPAAGVCVRALGVLHVAFQLGMQGR